MQKLKTVVMFSGGKDSTAMLHKMLEKGYPIDEIVFSDLGSEWPQMYEHIKKVEKNIDRKITRVFHPKGNFYYWFSEHLHTKGKGKGSTRGYGRCGKCRWGTAQKRQFSARFLNDLRKKGFDVVEAHGIALDEIKRTENNKGRNIIYPLVDLWMTENDCLNYCYSLGYDWGGLYEKLDRVSCWCCENKNTRELFNMYKYYPNMWDKLKILQKKTDFLFKGKGVEYFEKKFESITFFGKKG